MRVQELKPIGKAAIMGKKKHKLRKQAKENELCPSDSSDEGTNSGMCPHLSKGINFNTMKKALRQLGVVGECTSCSKNQTSSDSRLEDGAAVGAIGGVSDVIMEDKAFEEVEPTIWVCLQCGHQGCDRMSKEQHALKHQETPRSNSHAIVVNVNTWAVWCYTCDDELGPDSSRKLQECIEYIRKMVVSGSGAPSGSGTSSILNRSGSFKDGQATGETCATDTSVKIESKPTKPKPISLQTAASVTQGLPKVKGLSNLGNTCFFNAVMQNLSQTYTLEILLSERGSKCATVNLPGSRFDSDQTAEGALSDGSAGSDEDDDKKVEFPTLPVTLSEPGSLTQSLVTFMRDMHNPVKIGTLSPNNLFVQVCKKAPRFKGFQQQDSHELLRHLLDGMKAEEIKRFQTGILKHYHLSENVNPKRVDEDVKMKVKEYGKRAKHTFVDSIFGGVFISTVQCEECLVPSQIFEPFLDISLPILEEKTIRPNSMWGWRKKEELSEAEKTTAMDELAAADRGTSKYQLKKSKKQAAKDAKKKPKVGKTQSVEEENEVDAKADEEGKSEAKENPDSRSQSDGEISDADVEDNIESDFARNQFTRLNSQENDSPSEARSSPPSTDSGATCSRQGIPKPRVDRCDSAGRSEESTLTETSAGESKAGCSSCNSIASLSDSTCKASSIDSPFGSNTGINQPTDPKISGISGIIDGVKTMELTDSPTVNGKCKEQDLTRDKSDQSSLTSTSVDFTEETASTSNGIHRSSSHRSRSSGYSSGTTSKSRGSASATLSATASKSQMRLEAKHKAMNSLAPRYHPVSQECSVRSCLNQFSSAELLTGSNKFGCETCSKRKYGNSHHKEGKKDTVYTNASKQILVFQPPAILTLHLKRFQQVGFTLRKVNRHVEFPLILDLGPYCSSLCKGVKPGQTKVLYSLYGVVEHSGRLTGGHYTAYVKVRPHSTQMRDYLNSIDSSGANLDRLLETLYLGQGHDTHSGQGHDTQSGQGHAGEGQDEPVTPPPGKWYYISDSRVTEVTNEASVLRCQAYILFYERIQ